MQRFVYLYKPPPLPSPVLPGGSGQLVEEPPRTLGRRGQAVAMHGRLVEAARVATHRVWLGRLLLLPRAGLLHGQRLSDHQHQRLGQLTRLDFGYRVRHILVL